MSRTVIPTLILLALCASMVTALPVAAGAGHLTVAFEPAHPHLRLPFTGDAILTRTVTLPLQAGPNVVSFPFGRLDIPLDAVELDIPETAEGVQAGDVTIAPDARDTAQWLIHAEEACEVGLILTHPLKGIEWRVEYQATVNAETETLDVAGHLSLTNKSRLSFPEVRLELPTGTVETTPLPQQETLQLLLLEVAGIPYRPLFVHDTARFGGAVTALARVVRNGDDIFSSRAVPPGRVSIYGPGRPAVYVGEDTIPYLPPREAVELKLGAVPDVSVSRKLASSTQVEVRTDVRNRLVLFHQDDNVEFEVKNLRRVPLVVNLRDRVQGDWDLLLHSLPFERVDADQMEFLVHVAPGETHRVTYTARRHNLEP